MAGRVVLVGVGHAHLGVLAGAARLAASDVEVVAVAPDDFWYSGMATGVLGGIYPPHLDRVDVAALAARTGARFVRDVVTAIEPEARRVRLARGAAIDYDACSLDVGSMVPCDAVPGVRDHGVPAKPIARLAALRAALERRFGAAAPRTAVLVIGAGATGLEIAANVDALARRHRAAVEITVLGRGPRALAGARRRAAAGVVRALERRGIRIACGADVQAVDHTEAHLAGGQRVPYDVLVVATGLVPPPLAREAGLPVDADGALLTGACLESVADARVFGGGDAIAFRGRALPRVGVYAVRQAPVLLDNLLASIEGRPLRRFVPQRRFLLVMNLGDGTGLATWGGLHWQGRLAWRLKDRIDRRWMARWRAEARVESRDRAAAG